MTQFGGKNTKKSSSSDSKRHFTVVMGNKEHGLYVSSTPSSAAKKAVTKLCTANKSKKVEFSIREITQGSKKKTYGPYDGYIEKLKEPIELKGRVIRYKPVAKLSGKSSVKKRGMMKGGKPKDILYFSYDIENDYNTDDNWMTQSTQELEKLNEGGIFSISSDIDPDYDKKRVDYTVSFEDYPNALMHEEYNSELDKLKKIMKDIISFKHTTGIEDFQLNFRKIFSENFSENDNNELSDYKKFLTDFKKDISYNSNSNSNSN